MSRRLEVSPVRNKLTVVAKEMSVMVHTNHNTESGSRRSEKSKLA